MTLAVAACGSDADNAQDAAPDSTDATQDSVADMDDMDEGEMDQMAMNMGDATATAAADVTGARLTSGTFQLLDSRPAGYDDVAGTADLARHEAGMTVTLALTGLKPGVDFISHLHDEACSDNGGAHFKFDPDGSDLPPNEIHLAFASNDAGAGFMTAENSMTAGDSAVSIVVHPVEFIDNKIACAEFSDG